MSNLHERERPRSEAWITDELLAETQDAWAEVYGRPVLEDEAIEILWNSKRYAEVLIEAARQMQKNESTDQPDS